MSGYFIVKQNSPYLVLSHTWNLGSAEILAIVFK
jgi:hypothetical protein